METVRKPVLRFEKSEKAVFLRGRSRVKIPSLTVRKRKNRCIPCVYWAAAIFTVVSNYSNLFLPFAFFLDCSHFTFGYELVVCPEPTGLMKIICDLFPLIQRDKSLLLYPGEIHSF